MAKEKVHRWHECFGKYIDKKNCDGCIEESDCKEKSGLNKKAEKTAADNEGGDE